MVIGLVVHLRQDLNGVTTVYLASIYDKSEQENLTDLRLKQILAEINAGGS